MASDYAGVVYADQATLSWEKQLAAWQVEFACVSTEL